MVRSLATFSSSDSCSMYGWKAIRPHKLFLLLGGYFSRDLRIFSAFYHLCSKLGRLADWSIIPTPFFLSSFPGFRLPFLSTLHHGRSCSCLKHAPALTFSLLYSFSTTASPVLFTSLALALHHRRHFMPDPTPPLSSSFPLHCPTPPALFCHGESLANPTHQPQFRIWKDKYTPKATS